MKKLTKKLRKQYGITLIALIVTIIVLLILAGVVISTLTGENGLLQKTSDAQFKTEIAQYKEELNLSIITDEAEYKLNRTNKFNETEYNNIKKLIPSFNKKYENILVIEDDKLVYKGKDETFYKMAVKEDLISNNELLDDDILQELKAFITVWKTTEANEIVTIPITNINVDINWGDNSQVEHISTNNPTHTYSTPGEYEVSITGKVYGFYGNTTQLIEIKQWGVLGCLRLQFDNCTNLTGSIPEPSKNSFNSLYNSDEKSTLRFSGCTSLTGPVSEKLFYNVKTKYFKYIFSGCTGLTEIPEKLFSNNSEVINFEGTFYGCTGLTEIPENLFKNNTRVTNFGSTFLGCTGLTEIPENLFKNQKNKAQSFEGCFRGCTNLESIPVELFQNCTEASTFQVVFFGCNKITTIPDKLFENCQKAENFRMAFAYCKLNSVPAQLFKGCTSITNLSDLFTYNRSLSGKEIELTIESKNVTSFYQLVYAANPSVILNVPADSTTYNTISSNNNTYAQNLVINTF